MRLTSFLLLTVFVALPALAGDEQALEFFEMRVRPLLAKNCFSCHSSSKMGGLEMTSRESLLKGGQSGPAIVPGDAQGSLLTRVKDLKSRGLFNETLVIISGEFGRTPVVEVSGLVNVQNGRDHNNHGFTTLLAGGGVKGGMTYGATDDFGFKAVEKPVHPHDLQATILHLFGLDHTKLTYRYSGRDFRLTDVEGNVIRDILA
ncbi:MAG: DUF1501 domain-containing protein [Bryobacteraceae bacterium]